MFGNAVASHAVPLGVFETTHVQVCPWPKLGAEHWVMFVVGATARHVVWHWSLKHAASAVRVAAAAEISAATPVHAFGSPPAHFSTRASVGSHASSRQHASRAATHLEAMHAPHPLSSFAKRHWGP